MKIFKNLLITGWMIVFLCGCSGLLEPKEVGLDIIISTSAIYNSNFTVTFQFRDEVSNFELNDIQVESGIFSNFQETVGNRTYTIDIYRGNNAVALNIPVNSFYNLDGIGNSNSYSRSVEFREIPDLPLLITEVGNNPYYVWIEIYNTTSSPVDIRDYSIKSLAVNTDDNDGLLYIREFQLPDKTIGGGEFLIIRGNPNNDRLDSDQMVYVNQVENGFIYFPFINGGAFFFELILNGVTSDFVKNNYPIDPLTGTFSGNAPALMINSQNDYGKSISRNRSFFDSDSGGDWSLIEISTPGGFNDVTNSIDTDRDGIPDANESPGSTFAGMPLYDWGARPNVRDIFIHIDYMNSDNEGVIPKKEALDLIVLAFSNKNINVHFDVGDLFHRLPGISPLDHDLSDASHQVPFRELVDFYRSKSTNVVYDYKTAYMPINRKQIFHYALFANKLADGMALGVAELYGNDTIIGLGGFFSDISAPEIVVINYQATTLMHELGHNLGLQHGGNEDQNYKPNYYSVMNYLYAFVGVPLKSGAVSERYFHRLGEFNTANLTDGPLSNSFKINYSDGMSVQLNENSLNENIGIGRGLGSIDWNTNRISTDSNVSFNINPEDGTSKGVLSDYDDWGNLFFTFYRNIRGDRDLKSPSDDSSSASHSHEVVTDEKDRSQRWLDPCVFPTPVLK